MIVIVHFCHQMYTGVWVLVLDLMVLPMSVNSTASLADIRAEQELVIKSSVLLWQSVTCLMHSAISCPMCQPVQLVQLCVWCVQLSMSVRLHHQI